MKIKRFAAWLMAFILLCSMGFASSEQNGDVLTEMPREALFEIPSALQYTGGVVLRGYLKGASAAANDEQLEIAYVMTDDPYLILDQVTTWELSISGAVGEYECLALLAYQSDLSMDPFSDPWAVCDYFEVTGDTFEYTFTESGRYFWEFRLSDESGEFFAFQTRIYETYESQDQTNTKTVVGKVNYIVYSLIDESMSDYTRALVLHDWLIYNANYDYTYTYYDAAGVLLHGTGVCDSYARAYLMLCTAAGLECMYVSGTAGDSPDPEQWGAHGWNLVKLNGSWYHVDCTWDDPGDGGSECHTYFCVDDETMAEDHRWNTSEDIFDDGGMLVPEADGGEFEYIREEKLDHDFTFSTWPEFFEKFDAMVARGERRARTIGLYTGDLSIQEMYDTMAEYSGRKSQELANKGLITAAGRGCKGLYFYYNLGWKEPSAYVRIDETLMRLSIGETVDLKPSEVAPASDVYVWSSNNPEVAEVTCEFDQTQQIPVTAKITGVSAGTAVITVTSPDGLTDSVTVTVLETYHPDFAARYTEQNGVITIAWDSIPGATVYQVVMMDRKLGTLTDLEARVTNLQAEVDRDQLPPYGDVEVNILGKRIVNGYTIARYLSEALTIKGPRPVYAAELPEGTLTIGDEAFRGDVSLTSIRLPDGITSIGNYAFADCKALTTIRIPESVTEIGNGAFDGCTLTYAEVVKGSDAEAWFLEHLPDVYLIY